MRNKTIIILCLFMEMLCLIPLAIAVTVVAIFRIASNFFILLLEALDPIVLFIDSIMVKLAYIRLNRERERKEEKDSVELS